MYSDIRLCVLWEICSSALCPAALGHEASAGNTIFIFFFIGDLSPTGFVYEVINSLKLDSDH